MATVTNTPTHDSTARVVPAEDARQGEAPGRVRYVLAISLAVAAIAGIVIWSVFFL